MKKHYLSLFLLLILSGCIYRPIPGAEVIHEANDIEIPKMPITVETDADYGTLTIHSFEITSTLPASGNETSYSANYEMLVTTSDKSKEEIGFDFSFYNKEGFKIGWYSFKEKTTSEGEVNVKGNVKIPLNTTSVTFGKTSD